MTEILKSHDWLAHRYDPARDAVHFVKVTRDEHRKAPFLTDENLAGANAPKAFSRQQAVTSCHSGSLHYVFHSAFCCSTLLARAFDMPSVSMGLKEPVILNDISGWRARGATEQQLNTVMPDVLSLLARPIGKDEAVIVKPSNLVNALAGKMMQLRPDARALFIFAPLRDFLGSVARKGLWGRIWVRQLMVKQLGEGLINLGLQGKDYLELTDLQSAAVGWLAQHMLFANLARQFGPDRLLTTSSTDLLAAPHVAMSNLFRHFRLDADEAAIIDLVEGPVFTRHSKTDESFDSTDREADRAEGDALHLDEIEKVAVWADAVARNAGINMSLPSPLIR